MPVPNPPTVTILDRQPAADPPPHHQPRPNARRRLLATAALTTVASVAVAVLAVPPVRAALLPTAAHQAAAPGPAFPTPCTPGVGGPGGCLPGTPEPLPTPPGMPGPTPTPSPGPPNTTPPMGPSLPHPTPTPSPPPPSPSPSPSAPAPAPTEPPVEPPPVDQPGGIVGWISRGVSAAINAFFRGLVGAALNPLLRLLGRTVLATPTPDQLPRIGELWESTRQFTVAAYVLLVLVAGIVVMAHETVQTRYSIKQIAPRVVVGFLAANLSLPLAGQAIGFANAASTAALGDGVNPDAAAATLAGLVPAALLRGTNLFLILLGLALAVMLVALLVGYVVRVALTVMLIAAAPAALGCFGLPQTEGVARWWCRAFAGVLAIQVGQSLCLAVALRVFLTPGGFTAFGPTADGLVNLIVTLALVYILIKIPFWVLAQIRGGGRSFLSTLVRGFIAYRIFSALRGRGRQRAGRQRPSGGSPAGGRPSGPTGGPGPGARRRPRPRPGGGPADPYQRVRVDPDGQTQLPLTGVRRVRRPTTPRPATPQPARAAADLASRTRRPARGRQLTLPLDGRWPQDRPVLQRDGQYRLPIDVPRVRPPVAQPAPAAARVTPPTAGGRRRARPRQLEIPFDPYARVRTDRHGQYQLPLEGLARVRPPRSPATPPAARRSTAATPPAGRAARPRQLHLPLGLPAARRPQPPGQAPPPSQSPSVP
jgi:hypothetical protein